MENDRLAALWWLITLCGLRRGEAAALDRVDLDSEARELTISRQLVALPGELYCGSPKGRASIRTIALDEAGTRRLVDQAVRQTAELLRHQFTDQRRSDARVRTGPGWRCGRAMFTYADGRPIRPEYLNRNRLWSLEWTWVQIVDRLRADCDAAEGKHWTVSIDSTVVRAHQHAAGGPQGPGRRLPHRGTGARGRRLCLPDQVRRLGRVSAPEFGGGADRGDGGVDQVADKGVALVVGGSEGAG